MQETIIQFTMTNLLSHLIFLYGEGKSLLLFNRISQLIASYPIRRSTCNGALTERDSILITYGDQVQSPNKKPLQTLSAFCKQYLSDVIGGIHILPFDPWISGRWLFNCKKRRSRFGGLGRYFHSLFKENHIDFQNVLVYNLIT